MNLSSEFAKTFAFTYRNVMMLRRNIFMLSEIVYWPFITLLSIGFMLAFLKSGTAHTAVILSGVAAFGAVQTCQLDVAYVLLFDMWSKSMKHTMAAPIRPRHFLLGSWVVGIVRGTMTLCVLAVCMRWLFHFNILKAGIPALIVFWAGLMISGLLVGMFTTVCLFTFGMRAEIIPWSIVSVLLIACGIYYPISILPPAMQAVGFSIPLTWFLEAYRGAFGLSAAPHAALKGFALSGVYLAVLFALLSLSHKRALRRGFILKMSE